MFHTTSVTSLHIVANRYFGDGSKKRNPCVVDIFAQADIYDAGGVPYTAVEPEISEAARQDDPEINIGLICGAIATDVARGLRQGSAVLLTGGNCHHMTGVVGGIQDAYGAETKIGLIWFDAHGDFNTPGTTITGSKGGMPVAVAAGLAYPTWRELSHIVAPIPTDRILFVDVRNLDPLESQLIHATDARIAKIGGDPHGEDFARAVNELAERCDVIYCHIDADVADEAFTPMHGTKEPDGPTLDEVNDAVRTVMATGKVIAFALVSVYSNGDSEGIDAQSGISTLKAALESWRQSRVPGP